MHLFGLTSQSKVGHTSAGIRVVRREGMKVRIFYDICRDAHHVHSQKKQHRKGHTLIVLLRAYCAFKGRLNSSRACAA